MTLPIPQGRYDVPLIVKDAIFATRTTCSSTTNSESGLYGDVILVNGRPWPVMRVERRKYRFRILNASLSRSYEWALDTGEPLTVIATDGGLMPAPQQVAQLPPRHGRTLRGGHRLLEVPASASESMLRNLGPDNNINFDTTGNVMAFDIVGESTDPRTTRSPTS